jgi:hypothetical protein
MISFNLTRNKYNGFITVYTGSKISNEKATLINLLYQLNNYIKHGAKLM